MPPTQDQVTLSRRRLLRGVAGLGLGGLALAGAPRAAAAELSSPAADRLARQLSACHPPGDPLQALLAGNRRFAVLWQSTAGDLDPRERMARFAALWGESCQPDPAALARGQRPWAAVLTCADSRLSPEWLFDVGPGELFDVRSAGNTAFNAGIASLEYAVAELAVPLIVVLGHSGCGAVTAARASEPLTPLLEELVAPIRATLVPSDDLNQAVRRHARAAAAQLAERSPLLAEARSQGRLRIAAAYCDLVRGAVSVL
jgi:carbonic anhydrase